MLTGYLAGSIEGCTLKEASKWRDDLTHYFTFEKPHLVKFLNPMNGKNYLLNPRGNIDAANLDPKFKFLITPQAVFHRDLDRINRSDFVVVNLTRKSIGTVFEIGYTYSLNKPILLLYKKKEYIEHPFLKACCIPFRKLEDVKKYIFLWASEVCD